MTKNQTKTKHFTRSDKGHCISILQRFCYHTWTEPRRSLMGSKDSKGPSHFSQGPSTVVKFAHHPKTPGQGQAESTLPAKQSIRKSTGSLTRPLLKFRQRPPVCLRSLSPFLSDNGSRENILEPMGARENIKMQASEHVVLG